MPNKITEYGDGNWNWRTTSPFSQAIEIGDQIFISGQQALTEGGELVAPNDIAGQTRCVFENMKAVLERAGLDLSDLVRLNTYYVFDGADEDATEYWEAMTRVRLEYFPDPGPAATAVRIKGMPYQGQLIQIEGIALRGAAQSKTPYARRQLGLEHRRAVVSRLGSWGSHICWGSNFRRRKGCFRPRW